MLILFLTLCTLHSVAQGDEEEAHADGGELVGVAGHVDVAVPDDHHDVGLKYELHPRFGVYVDSEILVF